MLELIAMLTMLIDHLGYVIGNEGIFRMIGRVSFPIYSYLLVRGYKFTRNTKDYIKRLFLLALVSQIPYSILFTFDRLNAIFTLLLALLFLVFLEKDSIWKIPVLCSIIVFSYFFVTYDIYGIMLVLIFYYTKRYWLILLFIVFTFAYSLMNSWSIQLYAIMTLFILYNEKSLPKLKINRTIYRWFYPVHMALLCIYLMFK